ncbi:uncharacterized protein SPSK_07458 [Sporothrix schenckii 1099-18]|uniref:Trichothecene 3-O-acetyltransferase-like N-terminal domain-containing protein n=2 Tax=Sporothrix schenckii TaxID=29908 RepID=U7PY95_SPOS1|nr:uncharacterized protein SPSK_07458 [Sporothrix schenckii 1099-18]ERT00629.1 hypothetical protein HMPREF1624_01856 [Sporothrix schenckii ATCC 58251]KJR87691.1 hypothetical protein SPSK_07458 [Sporothrix schenckii 1099-18]
MAQKERTATRLSGWDQVAMRGYMSVALCFPFDNTQTDAAMKHIADSLARVALHRPDLAGTLEVRENGSVYHISGQNSTIPFSVEDIPKEFPYESYDELKSAEFPPGAFVHPQFLLLCQLAEGQPGVPVSVVKAFTIRGGLFLVVYFCHAFADGDCKRIFLEIFSQQTRGLTFEGPSTKHLNVPFANESNTNDKVGSRLNELLQKVPEYQILDQPVGPTTPNFRPGGVPMADITKIGKIFVFDNARLSQLRCSVFGAGEPAITSRNGISSTNGRLSEESKTRPSGQSTPVFNLPSNYTCLAGLTWAHISKARLCDATQYMPHSPEIDHTALLQTMVNWKSRALHDLNPTYFGNATAIAVTQLPTKDSILSRASSSPSDLAKLVFTIERTIAGVDNDFVSDRTELFSRVSDPRFVGLRFDPRTPQDLGFNTWRFFGADTKWNIPGIKGDSTPEVIRRLQGMWNMSGALILPAKALSPTHELLVTLPKTSMDVLCSDPEWMKWVDHVIG